MFFKTFTQIYIAPRQSSCIYYILGIRNLMVTLQVLLGLGGKPFSTTTLRPRTGSCCRAAMHGCTPNAANIQHTFTYLSF